LIFFPYEDDPTQATIGIDTGGGVQTFTGAATDTDALTFMQSFVDFANGIAGPTVFTLSSTTDDDTGGANFRISATTTYNITCNALALTLTGLNNTTGAAFTQGVEPAKGSVFTDSAPAVSHWFRLNPDSGDCSGAGALREQLNSTAGYKPLVSVYCDHLEAAAFAYAAATTHSPLYARVYQTHEDEWRTVYLGSIRRRKLMHRQYRFELEAIG